MNNRKHISGWIVTGFRVREGQTLLKPFPSVTKSLERVHQHSKHFRWFSCLNRSVMVSAGDVSTSPHLSHPHTHFVFSLHFHLNTLDKSHKRKRFILNIFQKNINMYRGKVMSLQVFIFLLFIFWKTKH